LLDVPSSADPGITDVADLPAKRAGAHLVHVMKRAALEYVARGFAVFPCFARSKTPATKHGLKDAVADAGGVNRLWTAKGYNLAVATGAISGIFVLDVDGEQGRSSLAELLQIHGPLPATLTTETGSGHHLYFRYPDSPIRTSQSKVGSGLDIRGDGGSAMLPPSTHPSGRPYRFVDPEAAIARAPRWLVELATQELERIRPKHDGGSPLSDRERWSGVEVHRMLSVLDPSMCRQDWIKVGMALHSGGYAFDVFDEWSSRSADKYDARDCAAQWRSFKEGGVTMGTLYAMAKREGWEPERLKDRREKRIASGRTPR